MKKKLDDTNGLWAEQLHEVYSFYFILFNLIFLAQGVH